jgi:hypothetical protein
MLILDLGTLFTYPAGLESIQSIVGLYNMFIPSLIVIGRLVNGDENGFIPRTLCLAPARGYRKASHRYEAIYLYRKSQFVGW